MSNSPDTTALTGATHSTIYVAVEISLKSWIVGVHCPDASGGSVSIHTLANAAPCRHLSRNSPDSHPHTGGFRPPVFPVTAVSPPPRRGRRRAASRQEIGPAAAGRDTGAGERSPHANDLPRPCPDRPHRELSAPEIGKADILAIHNIGNRLAHHRQRLRPASRPLCRTLPTSGIVGNEVRRRPYGANASST